MRFGTDDRAQAIQVGAVLIFGILILMFSFYQAFVVPNQNEEVDFNHHQDVERDMVEVRAAILQAKTTGEDRFATVKLGTEYPSRIIARNPPDPSGTLRTTPNKTITVETGDGRNLTELFSEFEPENRFLQFEPNYVRFGEASVIRYENTVVYKDLEDANFALSNQRLVTGDTISLVPLQREYQASGRQAASIEPIPGVLQREEVQDVNVSLGTDLTEEDWLDLFEDEFESNGNFSADDVSVEDGTLFLNVTGTFTLEYAPIGLDRPPRGGKRGDGGDDSPDINPASPGDIQLVGAEWVNGNDTVILKYRNNADGNNSFVSGRVAFYDRATPSVTAVRANNNDRTGTEDWPIPGDFRDLDPNIELPGTSIQTVEIDFTDVNINEQQQWFVLEFRLETGEVATYFVGNDFDLTS